MVGLLLTEKWIAQKEGKEVDLNDHEVVELLLEDYSRQLHSILGNITKLLGRVQTGERRGGAGSAHTQEGSNEHMNK